MPSFEIEVFQEMTRMGRFVVHDAADVKAAEEKALELMRLTPSVIEWNPETSDSLPGIVQCQQQKS